VAHSLSAMLRSTSSPQLLSLAESAIVPALTILLEPEHGLQRDAADILGTQLFPSRTSARAGVPEGSHHGGHGCFCSPYVSVPVYAFASVPVCVSVCSCACWSMQPI
jgi:hypothetical protein